MSKERDLQQWFFGNRYIGADIDQAFVPIACKNALMDWTSKPSKFLVVLGPVGSSKTYISSAVLGRVAMDDKIETIKSWQCGFYVQAKLADYIKATLLILEDIEFHKNIEELCSLIDSKYASMEPTIFTSSLTEEKLCEHLGYRTCSRLLAKENLVIDFHGSKDLRTCGK